MKEEKYMNIKNVERKQIFRGLFVIILAFFLIIPLVQARSFIVYNVSNAAQTYFIVNGSTGYVGIGTSTPSYPLDVSGSGRISGDVIISGALNVSDIANFTSNQIVFYQPLSIEASGPLSIANGIDLTDSTSNTINSYGTLYIKTSGVSKDIVFQPTGIVGLQSNLDMGGYNITNAGYIQGTFEGTASDLQCSDCVTLGTETTGNYVADITAGAGITVSGTAGEGWSPTVSVAFGTNFLGWGNLTNYPASCPEGYAVKTIGDTLTCIQINATQGVGDITSVTAGVGLTGGGTSGDVTLDVNPGWGLTTDATADTVNLSSSVAGTGLSFSQGVLSVVYGSTANTAAEGNKQITVSAGSGLTGGGTVTIGGNYRSWRNCKLSSC
jgi:hypothetical protein